MRQSLPASDRSVSAERAATESVRRLARPITLDREAARQIAEKASHARCVLIGEASHGTDEFYRFRAEITKVLIDEHGFDAVAVEADWPDAFRVNRYVRSHSDDRSAEAALGAFTRFPRWMWRNDVVLDFIAWLHLWNLGEVDPARKTGFYGLDLYSLHSSVEAVLKYLDTVDPEAAQRARDRYGCFDHAGKDAQLYGYATAVGAKEPCEDAVVQQLLELQQRAGELARRDGQLAADEFFSAEQNARLARNAEEYYRELFRGDQNTWNLRDRHMAETLDALLAHLDRRNGRSTSKVVVWAHNSHLGDARATQMGQEGELNLGQLVRERYGPEAYLIGMSTDRGTVSAASDWDGQVERKRVRPGMPESYERLFHDVGIPAFTIDLSAEDPAVAMLREPRLQRAIGVIYRPATERLSHYFHARLTEQFDLMIHIDETQALRPVDSNSGWEKGELPETYPFTV